MSGVERCAWCENPATVGTSATTPPLACQRHAGRLGRHVHHQQQPCGMCEKPLTDKSAVADPIFGAVHNACYTRAMRAASIRNRHED